MRISDWSSDVCSSDLIDIIHAQGRIEAREGRSGELRAAVERVLRRVLDTLAAGIAAGEAIDVGIFDIVSREYRIAIFGVVQRISDIEDKRSEEHTSELQSLMRISYTVFCLKKK